MTKVYKWDDLKDEVLGPVGTPRRDELEKKLVRSQNAYLAAMKRKEQKEAENQALENLQILNTALQAQKGVNV